MHFELVPPKQPGEVGDGGEGEGEGEGDDGGQAETNFDSQVMNGGFFLGNASTRGP